MDFLCYNIKRLLFQHMSMSQVLPFPNNELFICNYAPRESAGEMCRVLTFTMSRQWRVNAVVLFSRQNSGHSM